MATFYEMAKELRERLRLLFPGGLRIKYEEREDGVTVTITNYNNHDVHLSSLQLKGQNG